MLTEDYLEMPDPARSLDSAPWTRSLLSVTSDGLVGFKRVGGTDGTTVVPDLATALPVPTEGGRTYTFRLRDGVRFSNGRSLRPSDVRFTLERVFKLRSPGLDLYARIVGARACKQKPDRCDLSGGVVADDRAGTVTIRLREPDPEFLSKLALPPAFVVPAGTPLFGVSPVPGTGPYRVERYEPGRWIRLVRNRYFRPWSSAAQPQGIPDAIEWSVIADDQPAQVAAIEDARADVSDFSLSGGPDGLLDDLRTRYPARVHITPLPAMILAQPNTTRPPFDSLAARRALAFAVDRGRIVGLASGAVVQPSCQVLPPNFPGYRPYCPHTARPGSSWSAPDLARARELVRRSGTRGMRVDMITESSSLFSSAAKVVADALRVLGYRVSLKTYGDFNSYFDAFASKAGSTELALDGYVQDYPAPSEIIYRDFSCSPYFCDPGFATRTRRLRSSQTRDPQAALDQWARLDRELVERAVAIPLVNVKEAVFVSKRVGNYQRHPVFGPLVGQLWVR
jgi:peptide/nickel transport system substrate-binding protein